MKLALYLIFDLIFSWIFISALFHFINWLLDVERGQEPNYPDF